MKYDVELLLKLSKEGYIEMYLADTGEAVYKSHRLHSCRTFKRLECSEFINYAVYKIKRMIHGLLMLVLAMLFRAASFSVLK